MRVFQTIKENKVTNDNSVKSKKAARISKLELNLEQMVHEIFTFTQNQVKVDCKFTLIRDLF
jgi:hypothetical protein